GGGRWLARRMREGAVRPPQHGKLCIAERFAKRIRRAAERRGGLRQVVLEQPCLGERRADGNLVPARECARTEYGRERLSCFRTSSPLQRSLRSRQHGTKCN